MSDMPKFHEQKPFPLETASFETTSPPTLDDTLLQLEQAQSLGESQPQPPADESPIFVAWSQPEATTPVRNPHLGHTLVFAVMTFAAFVASESLALLGIHYRVFGVSSLDEFAKNIPMELAVQSIWYLCTLALCLLIFPLFWQKNLFAGLQWNGATALRLRGKLIGAACGCFVLAIVDSVLIPTKGDAPIDQVFKAPGGAWLLFAFGITFAPFFEEIAFRGFLLPTLCTAWDWADEQANQLAPLPLNRNEHPQWSTGAMIAGSIAASLPFAAMHAAQTGYSLGPFLLLICVSLVLCWVRLATASLAASTLVHSCYNFILFAISFLATDGFRHLDKL
jgi:uncharacterized protein